MWPSGLSTGLGSKGPPVQFPVRAHAWVSGQVPSRGCMRGNHTLLFLSLPLPFPLSKSKLIKSLKVFFLKKKIPSSNKTEKCLGITLTIMNTVYMNEIFKCYPHKRNLNKWKGTLCSWMEKMYKDVSFLNLSINLIWSRLKYQQDFFKGFLKNKKIFKTSCKFSEKK